MVCILCVFISFLLKAVTLISYDDLFLIVSVWMNVSLPSKFPQLHINHVSYGNPMESVETEIVVYSLYTITLWSLMR